MKNKLFKLIGLLASLASICGVFLFFATNKIALIVSLILFCLFLTSLFVYFIYVLRRYLFLQNNGVYSKKSSFVKYETFDGININFESYRHIQSKTLFLEEFPHNFKWTGSETPIITSKLQEYKITHKSEEEGSYDSAILKFPKPLMYNETAVVHFSAKLKDINNDSRPVCETKVDSIIDIIHYRIILGHKNSENVPNAWLKKKLINSDISEDFKNVESIPFNTVSKCYEYHLVNPNVGYFYKIEWEK